MPFNSAIPASLFPALLLSLGAGLLSFLSPCVLPLIPAYLGYISGSSAEELKSGRARGRVFRRSLAFVLGFSLVFVVLGLAFSGGQSLAAGLAGAAAPGGAAAGPAGTQGGTGGGLGLTRILEIAAGILIFLFGVNYIFDFAKFLNYEHRFHPNAGAGSAAGTGAAPRNAGLRALTGAFVLGLAFAFGWSPCVGPVLASILLLAAREASLGRAGLLLVFYSLGLALPFLAAGLFFDKTKPFLDWAKKHNRAIHIVSGILLAALGALMAFGRLGTISGAATRLGFALRGAAASGSALPRICGAVLWGLIALLISLPALRGTKKWTVARIVCASLFVMAAAAEGFGLFSSASILAGWLTFSGI